MSKSTPPPKKKNYEVGDIFYETKHPYRIIQITKVEKDNSKCDIIKNGYEYEQARINVGVTDYKNLITNHDWILVTNRLTRVYYEV